MAAALWSLPARAIGFGIEGGATFTQTTGLSASPDAIWTGNGGIIVENSFPIGMLFLDTWADVQTPIEFQTGLGPPTVASAYVPIDLGLRAGLNTGLLQPYLGLLGQAAILTDGKGEYWFNNPVWGIGGDVGLDLAISMFRIGVDLRGVGTVSAVATPLAANDGSDSFRPGNMGSAFEFEALASVRVDL